MVIGLWGELQLIQELSSRGISIGADIWNGPIKSAQDFQGRNIAVEVKTMAADGSDVVNISSEAQLDDNSRNALFLTVFRIERNDANGISLPEMVEKTVAELSAQQKGRFYAALLCLGYSPDDAALYNKGYLLQEKQIYQVKAGFPRLLRSDLPQGVVGIKYQISLRSCVSFLSDLDFMISTIKEYEYEQS